MAYVCVSVRFADGGHVAVTVQDKNPSPDCLDTMRRQAHEEFTDALAYVLDVSAHQAAEATEVEGE